MKRKERKSFLLCLLCTDLMSNCLSNYVFFLLENWHKQPDYRFLSLTWCLQLLLAICEIDMQIACLLWHMSDTVGYLCMEFKLNFIWSVFGVRSERNFWFCLFAKEQVEWQKIWLNSSEGERRSKKLNWIFLKLFESS